MNRRVPGVMSRALLLVTTLSACAGHGSSGGPIPLNQISSGRWRLVNRSLTTVTDQDHPFLRLSEEPDAGVVYDPRLVFGDGDIEVDVRGRDVVQKSFIGIAFHVQSPTEMDVVWLRPFNFVGTDSAHHVHAVQYASYPDWSWERLREEHPGGFEAPVPPSIKADAWIHLHLEIRGREVTVFLDRAAQPVLAVESPAGHPPGSVALWVGDKSPGDFANLVIRPLPEPTR